LVTQSMTASDMQGHSLCQSIQSNEWKRTNYYDCGQLFLLNLSSYLDRGIRALLALPIKQDIRLQDWQPGVVGGPGFGLLYSLTGIPIARLAERFNRITLRSMAFGIWSAMTVACSVAGSFVPRALSRAGIGGAEGASSPISYSLVSDDFPFRRCGMALSRLMASSPCAQLLAPLVGGYIAMKYGWRAAFVAVGLPGAALALLIRIIVTEPWLDARAKDSDLLDWIAGRHLVEKLDG